MSLVQMVSDFNGNVEINGVTYLSSSIQVSVNEENSDAINMKYFKDFIVFNVNYSDFEYGITLNGVTIFQSAGNTLQEVLDKIDILLDDSVFKGTVAALAGAFPDSSSGYSGRAIHAVGSSYLGGQVDVDGGLSVLSGDSTLNNFSVNNYAVFNTGTQTAQGGEIRLAQAVLNHLEEGGTDSAYYTKIRGAALLNNHVVVSLPSVPIPNSGGPYAIVQDPLTGDASWADTSTFGGSGLWNQTGDDIYYTTGNVGIGTAAPQAKLQVVGDGITSSNTGGAAVLRADRTDGKILALSSGTAGSSFIFDSTGFFSIGPDTRTNIEGTSFSTEKSIFINGSNEYVGIGTSTPSEKLHVGGNIFMSEGSKLMSETTDPVNGAQSQSLEFYLPYRSDGVTMAENRSALKLGGHKFFEPRTTNGSKLHVFNSLKIEPTNSAGAGGRLNISFGSSSDQYPSTTVGLSSWASFSQTPDRHFKNYGYFGVRFEANSAQYDINGQSLGEFNTTGLGIGTNTPSEKLDVVGKANINDGNNNVLISTGNSTITASNTVAVGYQALYSLTTGAANIAMGWRAGYSITDGDSNVAIGLSALRSTATGSNNIAIGHEAANRDNLNDFIAIGRSAGSGVATGTGGNILLGRQAGRDIQSSHNVFIGLQAGQDNTYQNVGSTYGNNIGIGLSALRSTAGKNNIGLGNEAGRYTSGDNNIAIGIETAQGVINSSSFSNTVAVGHQALTALTTGNGNTAVGYQAGNNITTSADNTILGNDAGSNLTVGTGRNTIIGRSAGNVLTTGRNNTLIGRDADVLSENSDGATLVGTSARSAGNGGETAIGSGAYAGQYGTALGANSRSDGGVAIGKDAYGNGNRNTIIGNFAGSTALVGQYNTIIGYQAGKTTAGSYNIFLGNQAGYNETGSNKLYIENSNSTSPLIYGEFDNDIVRVNGELQVGDPTSTGFKLPTADGEEAQILSTDGAGNVSWVDQGGGGGGASTLNDLTDVLIPSVADGDLLNYNSAFSSWIPVNSISLAGNITSAAIVQGNTGSFTTTTSESYKFVGTGDFSIEPATTLGGDLYIKSNKDIIVEIDTNNNDTSSKFSVVDGTERFSVDDAGVARFNNAFSLPNADGTTGQVLSTNGSGAVSWVDQSQVTASESYRVYATARTQAGGTSDVAVGVSVSKSATGTYDYTFDVARFDTSYVVMTTPVGYPLNDSNIYVSNISTTGFTVYCTTGDNGGTDDPLIDNAHSISVIVTDQLDAIKGDQGPAGDAFDVAGEVAGRTLVAGDHLKYLRSTSATAVTFTVPPQSLVAWVDNAEVVFEQAGTGQITIAAGSGVTINSSETLKSGQQYAVIGLKRVAQDTWTLTGERELA